MGAISFGTDMLKQEMKEQRESQPQFVFNKMMSNPMFRESYSNVRGTKSAIDAIKKLRALKKNVSTGPKSSQVYDAAVTRYSDGSSGEVQTSGVAPGIIDTIIQKMAPEETKKIAALEAVLGELRETGFQTGGKNFSAGEMNIIFGQMPSIYDSDEMFESKLNSFEKKMKNFGNLNSFTLIEGGLDKNHIKRLINAPLSKQEGQTATDAPARGILTGEQPKSGGFEPMFLKPETKKSILR